MNIKRFYLIGFFIILALPLLTTSLLFNPPAWGKTIVFRIILSILIFIFIYQIVYKKIASKFLIVKKLLPFWLLVALWGIFLLSVIFSLDPYYSFWESPLRAGGFLNFSFYIIFAILTFLFLHKQDWQKIWLFTIFIGVFVSIIAIFQQYNIFEKIIIPYSGRPPSTMGGPIFLALYLLLLVFITFSFLLKEKEKKKKLFYLLSLLLFLYVILLTGSRAAYFGLFVGSFYFLFLYSVNLVHAKRKTLFLLVKILLGILLIILAYGVYYINAQPELPQFTQDNKILREVASRFSIRGALDDPRFSAWKISLEAVKERPILGYGPENFSIAFDKYYDPSLPRINMAWGSWWDRAHNFIFEISVTAGILALIIYLSLFAVLFWGLQKIKKKRPEQALICHSIQATFLGYLAANFFSFDLFSTYLIFFLLVGYSLSLITQTNGFKQENVPEKPSENLNPTKSIFLCILFFILLWFIWSFNLKPLSINKEINWADYYVKAGQCEKALEKMEKDVLSSQSIIDNYAKLKYIDIIGRCSAKIPRLKLTIAPKAISGLKEATEIRPYYTRTWIFLGSYTKLLIENKEYFKIENVEELKKQAYSFFEKAYQLSPKHEELFPGWIQINLLSKKYQLAKEKAEECITLNPESSYCWWLKGLSNIYLEEIEQAEKNLKIATEKGHDPNSQKSLSQLVKAYLKLTEETGNLEYYEKAADIWIQTDLLFEKYQLAKEKAEECITLNPESSYCWWLKGLSNIYLEEIEQAEKNLKIATEKGHDPNSEKSLSQLAKAYLKLIRETGNLKYYEKSADIYQKLVLIKPDNRQYQNFLACAYRMLGEYEKAANIWQKLVLIEPDNYGYHNSLASVYKMLGEYEKAADIWQKLVLIGPDNYGHHNSLASVYKMLGEYEKAKEQALIVIELLSDLPNLHDLKKEVEKFLKTLP